MLTHRGVAAVAAPIHSPRIVHFDNDSSTERVSHAVIDGRKVSLAGFLAEHDVIVNCVLQDTDAPLVFMTEPDLSAMQPGSLVVDVSCDAGMGFTWARPTSFEEPAFVVGGNVLYYAVDHSPSYLWSSGTWENSEALLPFVPIVMAGGAAWDADTTIRKAIEVRDGVIQNPAILTFQDRDPKHPHFPLAT